MPRRKARLVARVVVLRDGDQLLAARHRHDDGADFWCLPGGAVTDGERFADAARREAAEEAGVAVELDGIVWVQDVRADRTGRGRVEVYFAARVTGQVPRPPATDRHLVEVAWWPLDRLATMDFRPMALLAALRDGPLPVLAGG